MAFKSHSTTPGAIVALSPTTTYSNLPNNHNVYSAWPLPPNCMHDRCQTAGQSRIYALSNCTDTYTSNRTFTSNHDVLSLKFAVTSGHFQILKQAGALPTVRPPRH